MFRTGVNKFNIFRKTDLFKVSYWNGIATIIKMAIGLVINKIVSIYLGSSGIALLGQFTNFTTLTNTIASMGINVGVTKYIAEHKGNEEQIKQLISTGFKLILLATSLTSISIFIGADYFCNKIIFNNEFVSIFYIFAATLFLFSINGFLLAILNGHKEFKKLIIINVCTSFVGLIIAVFLIINYGIFGALLGVVLSNFLVIIISILFIFKSNWFKISNFFSAFHIPTFKKLSKYTLISFSSIFSGIFIQLLIRTYIINHLSIEEAGYWQGIVKISIIYLTIITTTLSIYYLPRLSEIKDDKELQQEIINGYKFLLPLTIFSSLIIFVLRGPIIDILFAPSFQPMKKLLLFQLFGDIFKIGSWLLAYLLIAKAMVKINIITEIIFGFLFYVFTMVFLKQYGIVGVTYAYCLNYILYFVVMLFLFRKLLFLK
ncbi:O-antigen translocase [Candidatus Neomarinimicrobiota bacterium]